MSDLSDEEVAVLAELSGLEIIKEEMFGATWWIKKPSSPLGERWLFASDSRKELLAELRRLVDRDFGVPGQGTSKGTKESGTG